MTNLIPLDAAIAAIDAELKRYGFGVSGGRCDQIFVVLNAIPTIEPAAIREEALKEAVESLRDWQNNLIRQMYPDTALTVGMAADVVEAMIGEKK